MSTERRSETNETGFVFSQDALRVMITLLWGEGLLERGMCRRSCTDLLADPNFNINIQELGNKIQWLFHDQQSISRFLKGKPGFYVTWNRGEDCPGTVREVEIIDMLMSFFLQITISTSLTVQAQPSPRFHVEAWLPFRNCEMAYLNFLWLRKCWKPSYLGYIFAQ